MDGLGLDGDRCIRVIPQQKGADVTLQNVISILQMEDSISKTLQEINFDTKTVHYMKYNVKNKFVCKGGKTNNSIATGGAIPSILQKGSSGSNSLCFRYIQ